MYVCFKENPKSPCKLHHPGSGTGMSSDHWLPVGHKKGHVQGWDRPAKVCQGGTDRLPVSNATFIR